MKLFHCLLAGLTTAALSVVICSAGCADAPPQFTIENHQKLVTVKDGNGAWLFAQVLPSPNLTVTQVSEGQNRSRISLQDASGKTLWSQSVAQGIMGVTTEGQWVDDFVTVFNKVKSLDSSGGKEAASSIPVHVNHTQFIISSDDKLVSFRVDFDKHHLSVASLKNGFAAQLDGKRSLVVLVEPASSQPVASPPVASNVAASVH